MTIPSKSFPQDGQITEHFNLSEFACKGRNCCGNVAPISFDLVLRLEDLRALVGKPLRVNCGFRCRRHNAAVGGATNSMHMLGQAADLATPDGLTAQRFANLARRCKFGKVILYSWGIHVDARTW